MPNDKWATKYEQLNQRSRWYSSQLWYVPFAYLGIVGLAVEKMPAFPTELRWFGYFMLALFSFAVFVHICSLKYYERRAVRAMQKLEYKIVSGGASPCYLDFTSYMKLMLMLGTLFFAWAGISALYIPDHLNYCAIGLLFFILCFLWWKDRERNLSLRKEIRGKMPGTQSSMSKTKSNNRQDSDAP